MLVLLQNGEVMLFALIIFAIILSLTFHEFAHAATAKFYGDDTAEQMGRLNLNPLSHIDPIGLLMVVAVGFGYAKPVPVNPRNFTRPWAGAAVAAAGPFMNFILAIVFYNLYRMAVLGEIGFFSGTAQQVLFYYLAVINFLLMVFNLIPLGPLDGHYIAAYFLPGKLKLQYELYNAKYGGLALMALIVLSFFGVPIFSFLQQFAHTILPYFVIG